ncbi:AsnC family transcriptional regulator [Sphingobium sp. C100]|nr:AsnC family transcriptional regulator [Sphingobium sp. C100]
MAEWITPLCADHSMERRANGPSFATFDSGARDDIPNFVSISGFHCMDRFDIAIIEALQSDSRRSMHDLSDLVGLSPSACHRRVKALEDVGVIAGYVARLDPAALGLDLQAFVDISLTSQSRETMDRFEAAVADFPEILECHLMAGQADYLLRVAAADLKGFDAIHRDCLARLPGVSAIRTSFAIRRIRDWQGYRLRGLKGPA